VGTYTRSSAPCSLLSKIEQHYGGALSTDHEQQTQAVSRFIHGGGDSEFNFAGRGIVQPSEVGDPAASSYLGMTSPYYINNGKVVT
jgi:hypothetical protein